ncbi:MAG: PEP-CTERM sorting domain-containing protein [Bryobacteraceae bacterium]|nr:PEP-CTERM sorting domain-containing protein [Bryobacteraceae bacterium]
MHFIRVGLLCVTAVAPLFADTIVVPGAFSFATGPYGSSVPFTWFPPNLRSQTVYNASLFSSITEAVAITGVSYRLHRDFDVNFNYTIPDFQLTLSTTSAAAGGLSTTFANNTGSDATVVRTGPLTLAHTVGMGAPRPFNVSVSFSTPFLYDPSAGNFLMDYRVTGNTPPTAYFDSTFDFSPGGTQSNGISGVLTDQPNQANAFPLNCCPASNGTQPGGLIIQLEYDAASEVPEPATLPLTGAAGVAAVLALRRQSARNPASQR